MSSTAISLGIGVAFRVFINAYCAQNDRTAGALLGVWDGIVLQRAWHADRLADPTTLFELAFCLCADVLFRASALKAFVLVLGGVLGVLLADIVLPALWDDLSVTALIRTTTIVDDLDASDVLSEFSEDVTVIYEEYSTTVSTAAWIAAQRKARKASSSRQATAADSVDQNSLGTSTLRKSGPPALSVPLPPRSLATSIHIGVQPPSSPSRVSSPTIQGEESIPEIETPSHLQSARSPSNASTPKAMVSPVSPISLQQSSVLNTPVLASVTEVITPADALPSFLNLSHQHELRSQKTRSVASTRVTERVIEERAEMIDNVLGVEIPRAPAKSESATPHRSGSLGHTLTENPHQSASYEVFPRPASPARAAPELIIDYSRDMTQIVIPPPLESVFSVRITSHVDEEQRPRSPNPEDTTPVHSNSHVDQPDPVAISLPRSRSSPSEIDNPPNIDRSPGTPSGSSPNYPPSVFEMDRAWRSFTPPMLRSGGEHRAYSEHQTPYSVFAEQRTTSEFHILHVEAPSQILSRQSPTSSERPLARRARSVASRQSRSDSNILELDVQGNDRAAPLPVKGHTFVPHSSDADWLDTLLLQNRSVSRVDVEDHYEGPSSVPLDQFRHVQQSLVSSPTLEETILSSGPNAHIFVRAQELRQQAKDAEERCRMLQAQQREAHSQGRHAQAFALGFEIEDVEAKVRKLHRKAERRFYLAKNTSQDADKIDIHHLKVHEAIRQTERALYVVQRRGGRELQVIVGHGKHFTVLKHAIIDKMTKKHHLNVNVDRSNPGLLRIFLN